jgi:hypothetical protein
MHTACEPNRLGKMLQTHVRAGSRDRSAKVRNSEQLANLRHARKEAEAAIACLLELVEKGLMYADDPALRERLIGLNCGATSWRRTPATFSAVSLQASPRSPRTDRQGRHPPAR